jgi:hypothetical protein
MLRRVLTRFLPPIAYVVVLVILLAATGQLEFASFGRVDFLVGLLISIGIGIAIERWPRRFYAYALGFVIVVLFGFGIFLINFSRNTSFWDNNPPWNPSVLGAGVSITALACAFLFASWPLFRAHRNGGNTHTLPNSQINGPALTNIQDIIRNHQILILGLAVTFILLMIFIILQQFAPSAMQLDGKWIVVAAIPIILALIVGGYIKVIKGFGFELEVWTKKPVVTALDLKAGEFHRPTPRGIMKDTVNYLESLSVDHKRRITRLQFEVVGPRGAFICLIPVGLFYFGKERHEANIDELRRFIQSLEDNFVMQLYGNDAVSFRIPANLSIIDVLELLYSQGVIAAVVENSRGSIIGVIYLSDIEKRIVNEVILEAKRKKKL